MEPDNHINASEQKRVCEMYIPIKFVKFIYLINMLSILYEDPVLVIINKPPGILVHRTRLSEDKVFVLQLLRDQLGGGHLYPAHRLDRATSGVLVFARNPDTASWIGEQLMDHRWEGDEIKSITRCLPRRTNRRNGYQYWTQG